MTNTKTGHIYSRNFSIRMLNLSHIDKVSEEEKQSELYDWARLFLTKEWEEIEMLEEKSESIREAVGTLRELTADDKIRLQCEARERYDHDMATLRYVAETKGMQKGLERGREQGLKRGLEKGREYTQMQVAQKLIKMGMKLEEIAEVTGLSIGTLEDLKISRLFL